MPSLSRTRDGAGDSGAMSLLLRFNPDLNDLETKPGVPEIGWAIRVGSLTARSFNGQDWWQTSYITEILEDTTDDKGDRTIRFLTGNSEYVWKD